MKPTMAMGQRIPMPFDMNQAYHMTMQNHNHRDTMQYGGFNQNYGQPNYGGNNMLAYGGRGIYQIGGDYMGPLEEEPLETEGMLSDEPELRPIYSDPEQKAKRKKAGKAAAQGAAAVGAAASPLLGEDAGGVTGDVLSAAPGGPIAMAAAGIGSGIDLMQKKKADKLLGDQNFAADSGMVFGNTAAYGARTHMNYGGISQEQQRQMMALGESLEVQSMKNRGLFNGNGSSKTNASGGFREAGNPNVQGWWNDKPAMANGGFSSKRGNAATPAHMYGSRAPQGIADTGSYMGDVAYGNNAYRQYMQDGNRLQQNLEARRQAAIQQRNALNAQQAAARKAAFAPQLNPHQIAARKAAEQKQFDNAAGNQYMNNFLATKSTDAYANSAGQYGTPKHFDQQTKFY